MLLKGHLGIKCHSQYNKAIKFLQYSSANSSWTYLGMHCARPRDYHNLGLTLIQFHPPKVTPLTNHAKVTDQGLCHRNSDAWGWHNSHQSGVISITDQLILQNVKKILYRRNNSGPKTLPYDTPDITLTSLLRQPSTITCSDRFDRNSVNIDKTEPPIPTEQSFCQRWTFRNWSDIGLSPTSRKTTQTNKPTKHCTETGAVISAVLLTKRGNIPNG